MVESTTPTSKVDITIVDAMFLLHTIQDLPITYGEIASLLMVKLCGYSCRVDIVFDTYLDPSVKDVEHERRCGGAGDADYTITGPSQKRPKDWKKALRSITFKTALCKFLFNEWRQHANINVVSGHDIYVALEKKCYCLRVHEGKLVCEDVEALSSNHIEADTRIILHMFSMLNCHKHISVRTSDTDVFILLIYHVSHHQDCNAQVWMDAGLSSNNTRRHINISNIVEHLSQNVIDALPGLHAFTGSDYTAAFMNKGKVRPLQIMMKDTRFADAFSSLGNAEKIDSAVADEIERFTCNLYGFSKLTYVDDVRHALFQQKYLPKQNSSPFEKLQAFNPSSMPPCQQVLHNKIRRANFVASMWKKSNAKTPIVMKAEDNGWNLDNGRYSINWFTCPQLPNTIIDIISDLDEQTDDSDDEASSIQAASYSSDECSDTDDYD